MPELAFLLAIPLAGAGVVALLPKGRQAWVRGTTLTASLLTMGAAVWVALGFDPSESGLQFYGRLSGNERMGSDFVLGVDGLSLPLVLLAVLLNGLAVLASAKVVEHRKGYAAAMLCLESAVLGVFLAQDWSVFYIFWELTLLPVFFLINHWGGEHRGRAALNFMLYTMGGSVFMLVGLLYAFDVSGTHSFSMVELAVGLRETSPETQFLILMGFLIGFGVKMPIFPLHGWQPLAYVEAPTPVTMLLSGILSKMGFYGLLRAAVMLPEAMVAVQGFLATVALINIIYGGILAWRQSDLKVMLAYSSFSHTGVILLGIAAMNSAGLTGAVVQMVAHGLVAAILFLLLGLLAERGRSREVGHYGGLVGRTPRFAFFVTLAFLGAVGVPGTAGFVAELHTLIGAFQRWGWAALLLSVGMLIGAAYSWRTIGRLFTGPPLPGMGVIPDLERGELVPVVVLAGGVVGLGFFPMPLLSLIETSVGHLTALLGGLPG
ncbi:MAG: NADH-quinone oxidoreductase subunit M [Magnetococcales bacterium]|nr:NADH-quinone oxidoreductase subunit M [Magnetococcales bacterium]